MGYSRILMLTFSIFGCVKFYGGAVAIETPDSHIVVTVGEPKVVITCLRTETSVVTNPSVLKKIPTDGSEPIRISGGFIIDSPFKESGRYSISTDKQLYEVINLTISDVTLGDNGTYKCDFLNEPEGPQDIFTVLVQEKLQDMNLDTSGDETVDDQGERVFTFEHDRKGSKDPYSINCTVQGGHPMPEVTVHIGDIDVTSEFEKQESPELTNRYSERGLEETRYDVTMQAKDFQPKRKYNGKRLECRARIPGLDLEETVKSAEIRVIYPPKFTCEERIITEPGREDLQVTCIISANPPLEPDTIIWSWEGENETLNYTMKDDLEDFTITAVARNSDEIEVTLHIEVVNETDFRAYKITAENEVAKKHFEIEVIKENEVKNEEKNEEEENEAEVKALGAAPITSFSLSVTIATLLAALAW